MDYMVGPHLFTRVLIRERGAGKLEKEIYERSRGSSDKIASFQNGEGERELRNVAVSGSWKRQGNEFSPRAS